MKYLLSLIFLLSATSPSAAISPSVSYSKEVKVVFQPKQKFFKNLSVRILEKRYRPFDNIAIWAVGFAVLPFVATLLTYVIAGGYAAAFMLLFTSIFSLLGVVLGMVALIRAIFRGWRRGTFWAAVAIAIPFLFLAIVGLIG